MLDRAHIGEVDGILGLDSLQNQRVLLDFAKRTISVADAEQLGGSGCDVVGVDVVGVAVDPVGAVGHEGADALRLEDRGRAVDLAEHLLELLTCVLRVHGACSCARVGVRVRPASVLGPTR